MDDMYERASIIVGPYEVWVIAVIYDMVCGIRWCQWECTDSS
jgi:hypothetical protein